MNQRLSIAVPHIAAEFDSGMNNGLSAEEIYANANIEVWWKCKKGHSWKARVLSRVKRDSRCPYCSGRLAVTGENDVATLFPRLKEEFRPEKNMDIDLSKIKASSAKTVIWTCEKGHDWPAKVYTRTKQGRNCPYCAGQRIIPGKTDLLSVRPGLKKTVHPTLNSEKDILTLGYGSRKEIWWICKYGHEYKMSVSKKTIRGYGCPYCSGKRAIQGVNDLATTCPELMEYWDEEKNGEITRFKKGSRKTVSWKCDNNHCWQRTIYEQQKENRCPECSLTSEVVMENSLGMRYPELVDEWDKNNNTCSAFDVSYGSKKKVHWKCKDGHCWTAAICNRIRGQSCPYCMGKLPVHGENDLETMYPNLAEEWHPTYNHENLPRDYLPKSNKKVWWQCKYGHSWKTKIVYRTVDGCNCPECYKSGG